MPVWVKSWVTLSCSLFIIIIIIIIKKHALKIEEDPPFVLVYWLI